MTINESPQLIAIKQKYKHSLSEKADFVFAWVELEEPARDEFVELASWLHKFAGSAGMYGYDDLARGARRLLRRAEEVLTQSAASEVDFFYQTQANEMQNQLCQLGELMRTSVD